MVDVNVSAVVDACLAIHARAASAKDVCLARQPDCGPLFVRSDEEGLRQILDNLVDNAIKYTPDGGNVSVGWRAEDSKGMIVVEDTGLGIAPEDQERLFERFFRVDKARSREMGGTGLGLAIVKHLTQSFGGRVTVQSTPGSGSKFVVELPLASSSSHADFTT